MANSNRILQTASFVLLAPWIVSCTKTPESLDTPTAGQAQDAKQAIKGEDVPIPLAYYLRQWRVCSVDVGTLEYRKEDHAPLFERFNIVEIDNRPGQYTIQPVNANNWSPGWMSLVLTPDGTQYKDIPPATWNETQNPCKDGVAEAADPQTFSAAESTYRLRGAICLPDGIPNHAGGTCSNDDPANDKYHYHEIVVFARNVRTSDDNAHIVIQHCSRGELKANQENPKGPDWQCPPPKSANKGPHPGHVHGDP